MNEAFERELYELEELLALLTIQTEKNTSSQHIIEEIKQSIQKLKTRINTHE